MQVFELKGELRSDFGKKASKAIRNEGKVPCAVYGVDKDENGLPVATHFTVVEKDLMKLLYTPIVYIVKINLGSKTVEAILKEIQFHPVTDKPLHIDFYQISENKPVVMEVPVKLTGFAAGVQAGGKLAQVVRKVAVKAVPANLPSEITIDVTNLGLGKTIKVKDLSYDNFELASAKDVVIVQVKMTRAAKATEEAAAK